MRGLAEIVLDLKHEASRDYALSIIDRCDVLIEGFRPGVAERLGLGPEVCHERNPRLIYTRITGWGQTGPYASSAGHDIDYIAVSGALDTVGRAGDPPLAPLYYLGDWASGAMLLAVGVLAALVERQRSGRGQVIDTAIVDGVVLMLGEVIARAQRGAWVSNRGANILNAGAWYDTFETADGAFMAVGALEPKFYRELLRVLELAHLEPVDREDREQWPELKRRIAEAFMRRSQEEWCEAFADADACVAPVRTLTDAMSDPHLVSRGAFVELDGRIEPAPAPRFDRTPARARSAPDVAELLARWGVPRR
jgi:alpha-methylacyl-CoA racemase